MFLFASQPDAVEIMAHVVVLLYLGCPVLAAVVAGMERNRRAARRMDRGRRDPRRRAPAPAPSAWYPRQMY